MYSEATKKWERGKSSVIEIICRKWEMAIMQNMIFDSVFEVDSVLENKSDFLIVADSILNKRIWNNQIEQWRRNAVGRRHLPTTTISEFWECYLFLYQKENFTNRCKCQVHSFQCPFINYWATKSLDLYRILYNCFDFTSLNFVLMCVPVKSKKPSNHTILIPGFFLVL